MTHCWSGMLLVAQPGQEASAAATQPSPARTVQGTLQTTPQNPLVHSNCSPLCLSVSAPHAPLPCTHGPEEAAFT